MDADEDAKRTESGDDLDALGPETKDAAAHVLEDDAIDRAELAKLSQGRERAGAPRAQGAPTRAEQPPLSAAAARRRLWLLPLVIGVGIGVSVSVLVISLPRGGGEAHADVKPIPQPLPPPPPSPPPAAPSPSAEAPKPVPSAPEASAKPAPAAAAPKPAAAAKPESASAKDPAAAKPPAKAPAAPPPPAADGKPHTEEELAAAAVVNSPSSAETVMDHVLDDALAHPKDRNAELRAARQAAALAQQDLPLAPSRDDVVKAMSLLVPAIRGCAQGKSGLATVTMVVRNDGHVESAALSGVPFAGTASGGCMEGVVRRAKFPRFKQASFRVQFPFAVQ